MRRVRVHWRWQIQRKLWRQEVRTEGGGDGVNQCNRRGSEADHKCQGVNLSHCRHELWLWKSACPLMAPLATRQVLLNYELLHKTHKLLCEISCVHSSYDLLNGQPRRCGRGLLSHPLSFVNYILPDVTINFHRWHRVTSSISADLRQLFHFCSSS